MGFFIGIGYYEGDRVHSLDVEVPQRPNAFSTWNGSQWITPTAPEILDILANLEVDGRDKLMFEINYDQENRLRIQEARPQITKIQYRNALIQAWKDMNGS